MNRSPVLARIVAALVIAAAAISITGCAGVRGLVTAKVEFVSGTNRVSVVQPKDTTIDELTFNPATGALRMKGYASAGNAEAIASARAQAEAQAVMFGHAVDLVGQLTAATARMYGVPVGPIAPAAAPAASETLQPPPAGMKWTLGTSGIPILAPKDDPSRPQPE